VPHSPPADRAVLAAAGLTFEPATLAPPDDFQRAIGIAMSGAFPSVPAPEHVRELSASEGVVRAGAQIICQCVTVAVVRTVLPACPGVEIVEQEAVVLVDLNTGAIVRIQRPVTTPGTTFGRCG
jgi:hypothetical protein